MKNNLNKAMAFGSIALGMIAGIFYESTRQKRIENFKREIKREILIQVLGRL